MSQFSRPKNPITFDNKWPFYILHLLQPFVVIVEGNRILFDFEFVTQTRYYNYYFIILIALYMPNLYFTRCGNDGTFNTLCITLLLSVIAWLSVEGVDFTVTLHRQLWGAFYIQLVFLESVVVLLKEK